MCAMKEWRTGAVAQRYFARARVSPVFCRTTRCTLYSIVVHGFCLVRYQQLRFASHYCVSCVGVRVPQIDFRRQASTLRLFVAVLRGVRTLVSVLFEATVVHHCAHVCFFGFVVACLQSRRSGSGTGDVASHFANANTDNEKRRYSRKFAPPPPPSLLLPLPPQTR